METCRLCLNNEQLVWIFDQRILCPNNMKDVIRITTGIEITQKDVISQKICAKCCQVTIKMFQFRTTALKNDLELKKQYEQSQKIKEDGISHAQAPAENCKKDAIVSRPATPSADFRKEKTSNQFLINEKNQVETEKKLTRATTPSIVKSSTQKTPKPVQKPSKSLHFSVKDLFKAYPSVRIPAICLNKHLSPTITLSGDDVNAYFKEKEKSKSLFETALPSCIKITKVDSAKTSCNRKRKLDDLDNDKHSILTNQSIEKKSKLESNSETVIDSDKTIVQESTLEPMCVDKTVAILICEICNNVCYNSRDLHNHKKKHLKCQFCKKFFKTLDRKQAHLQNLCDIKNMMNNLPIVSLTRLQNVLEMNKYSSNAQLGTNASVGDTIETVTHSNVQHVAKKSTGPDLKKTDDAENIYCISDDSDTEFINDGVDNKQSEITLKKSAESTYKQAEASLINVDLVEENIAVSKRGSINEHILKPIINCKNNCILNFTETRGTDIKSIATILTSMKNAHLKQKNELSTQTYTPTCKELVVNRGERLCEFRKFNHLLKYYRIPLNIARGEFDANIEYNYNENKNHRRKEIRKWHVLNKIDIQLPKSAANRQNSTKSTPAHKTDVPNCNSCDIIKKPQTSFKQYDFLGNKKNTASSKEVNQLTYTICDLPSNFFQILPNSSSSSTKSSLNPPSTVLTNSSNKITVSQTNQSSQPSIHNVSNNTQQNLPISSTTPPLLSILAATTTAYTPNIFTPIINTTSNSVINLTKKNITTPITQINQSSSECNVQTSTIHHTPNICKQKSTTGPLSVTQPTKTVSAPTTLVPALNPIQIGSINYSLSNTSNSSHRFIYGVSAVAQQTSKAPQNANNLIKIVPNSTKTFQINTSAAIASPPINQFVKVANSIQPGNSPVSPTVKNSVDSSNQTNYTNQITNSNTSSTKLLTKDFDSPSNPQYQKTNIPKDLRTAIVRNLPNRIQIPTKTSPNKTKDVKFIKVALSDVQKLSGPSALNENSTVNNSKNAIRSKENKTTRISEQSNADASKFVNSTEYNVFLEDMPKLAETLASEPVHTPCIRVKNVWELK